MALGTIDVLEPERASLPSESPAIILVFAGSVPVGRVEIAGGRRVSTDAVAAALSAAVVETALRAGVSALLARRWPAGPIDVAEALMALREAPPAASGPCFTVAICTRDREPLLERALASVFGSLGAGDELLVVDNASRGDGVAPLVGRYPGARLVREDRPGLGWARNRAIIESRGDIVAFCDDDCVMLDGTIAALRSAFARNPDVDAVTGLVEPLTLDTAAQELFDRYLTNAWHYTRRWICAPRSRSIAQHVGNVGRYGTGASLAIRRGLFDRIGVFDAALGPGALCRAGDDMEFFFRMLKSGAILLREPRVSVRHDHRVDRTEMEKQFEAWSGGFACAAARSTLAFPEERVPYSILLTRIALLYHARRALMYPGLRAIAVAELRAMFGARRRYRQSRQAADALARAIPSPARDAAPVRLAATTPPGARLARQAVDLAEAPVPLAVASDGSAELTVTLRGRSLGSLTLEARNGFIGADRLCDAVGSRFAGELLGMPWPTAVARTRALISELLSRTVR